jgi:hypothetical protein
MEYNLGIQGEYDLVMKGGQCVEEHFMEGIEGNGPHVVFESPVRSGFLPPSGCNHRPDQFIYFKIYLQLQTRPV